MGKGKLVLFRGYIILCLEFCGVVLVIEFVEIIFIQLDILLDFMYYYIDSKVVLGYISNCICCFYMYVSNRVDCILKIFIVD